MMVSHIMVSHSTYTQGYIDEGISEKLKSDNAYKNGL